MSQTRTQNSNIFTAHPQAVGESYFQHLFFASKFAGWMFLAGLIALIHALLPFLFEHTAGNIVKTMARRLMTRE